MRAAVLAAGAFLCQSAVGQNFEFVDTLPTSMAVQVPAYSGQDNLHARQWIQAGALRDSNLFRLSSNADPQSQIGSDERAVTVGRIGAGLRREVLTGGGQSLQLQANGDQYSYEGFHELDHFAYGLRGQYLWIYNRDLSGNIGYERQRRLIDLGAIQRPLRDLITSQRAFADVLHVPVPALRLRGAAEFDRAEHSQPPSGTPNLQSATLRAGAEYVSRLDNALGAEFRLTNGESPFVPVGSSGTVDNDFRETEVALVGIWMRTGSRAVARVGHTVRKYEVATSSNFSGSTGRLAVDWTPTSKTGLELTLYREPRSIVDASATYVLTSGISLGPRWAYNPSFAFRALALRENQRYAGDQNAAVLGAPQRDETVKSLRVGAAWEPRRLAQLSLAVEWGERSSNVALRDYSYRALVANATLGF